MSATVNTRLNFEQMQLARIDSRLVWSEFGHLRHGYPMVVTPQLVSQIDRQLPQRWGQRSRSAIAGASIEIRCEEIAIQLAIFW